MKMPTREEMRAEFHRLSDDLKIGMAKVAPKQAAYEAKRAEIERLEAEELKPLEVDLKATREALGLHAIQQQMGMINRALSGETGADPAKAEVQEIAASDVGKLPN